jgi:catechol 2,3-dioxygenase-like lactoylglutathione lyase family enzyme
MKLKPSSVAVVVKDVKRSKKFYVQKLGMKVLDDMEHWVTVGQPRSGMRIHLCETKPPEKGNTGIALIADGPVLRAYAVLKKKGVKFSVPPKERPWGLECRLLDPDGNEYWLVGE